MYLYTSCLPGSRAHSRPYALLWAHAPLRLPVGPCANTHSVTFQSVQFKRSTARPDCKGAPSVHLSRCHSCERSWCLCHRQGQLACVLDDNSFQRLPVLASHLGGAIVTDTAYTVTHTYTQRCAHKCAHARAHDGHARNTCPSLPCSAQANIAID